MPAKTSQLQIRVSPQQKATLKRLARESGCDVSAYVLSRLPLSGRGRFAELLREAGRASEWRFALAELNDFLVHTPPIEFAAALESAALGHLSPYQQNYIAAMVEQAAAAKGLQPPAWVREVEPLAQPQFATPLKSLRGHLLRAAPVPFKRRNLFVDASVGARV